MAKNLILWVIIAIVLMSVFNNFGSRQVSAQQMSYSQFINEVKLGRVDSVSIDDRTIKGTSQIFGCPDLITVARGLEERGRNGDLNGCDGELDRLRDLAGQLQQQLRDYLSG